MELNQMAKWLLNLYPRYWRNRYEGELMAVIEQHKVSFWTLLDLLWSAGVAHLEPPIGMGVGLMITRMRGGISAIFCAFIAFGVAYLPMMRVSDPLPTFHATIQTHPEVQEWFHWTVFGGPAAFLAILIGGLPILFVAVKHAWVHKSTNVLRPLWTAAMSLVLFAGATAFLGLTHIINGAIVLSYLLLFLVLLVIGTSAIAKIVMRGNVSTRVLHFALWCGVIASLCMVGTNVGTAVLMALIHTELPQLTVSQDTSVPMLMGSAALMLIAEIAAIFGMAKGFTGKRALAESEGVNS